MITLKSIHISLLRAVEFININLHTASRIEEQNKEILKRLEIIEKALVSVHDHMNDCAKASCGKPALDKTASELMQEGIDNIMGFQWPPKKGGN